MQAQAEQSTQLIHRTHTGGRVSGKVPAIIQQAQRLLPPLAQRARAEPLLVGPSLYRHCLQDPRSGLLEWEARLAPLEQSSSGLLAASF
jgi:hypothetical protein